jgi:hypothetical protein
VAFAADARRLGLAINGRRPEERRRIVAAAPPAYDLLPSIADL